MRMPENGNRGILILNMFISNYLIRVEYYEESRSIHEQPNFQINRLRYSNMLTSNTAHILFVRTDRRRAKGPSWPSVLTHISQPKHKQSDHLHQQEPSVQYLQRFDRRPADLRSYYHHRIASH